MVGLSDVIIATSTLFSLQSTRSFQPMTGPNSNGGRILRALSFSRSSFSVTRVSKPSCISYDSRLTCWKGDAETADSVLDLELEKNIYEFMRTSRNPDSFPTKKELFAAGRGDLAISICTRGGWFALGWDLEDEDEHDRVLSSSDASPSGRILEQADLGEEESGIQGIVNRLDKERSFSYHDCNSRTSVLYAGIAANDNSEAGKSGLLNDTHFNFRLSSEAWSGNKNGGIDQSLVSDSLKLSQIQIRLQQLESRLNSLMSLLSSKNTVMSTKFHGSSGKLHDISDALDFQQTEITKAQDKQRSTQARMVVLEGRISLEKVKLERVLEDKQKRIDTVRKGLEILQTSCIVWPNSASEVLLAGSFDGWTSQRRMERSSMGIFSVYLKLYPGRYEIKFIVDSVWKIDPLRPVVNNNGYENNLLVV